MRLWTRQSPAVIEAIRRDGEARVLREYVEAKYADAAWSFRVAYDFFSREMARRVPRPDGCESPYWLHGTPEATGVFGSADDLAEFDIPRADVLVFDAARWNRVLNLDYIGRDERDEAAFADRLAAQGVAHSSEVFAKPFWPMIKSEITRSWARLFEGEEPEPARLQGAAWTLRREWLVRCGGR